MWKVKKSGCQIIEFSVNVRSETKSIEKYNENLSLMLFETPNQSRHLLSSLWNTFPPFALCTAVNLSKECHKPGWMSFHCKCQWLSQPFLGRQSCYADVFWQQLAFPMVAPPFWLCAISWSKPMVYVSIHVKNADGHGYASIQPIDHWI